MKRVGCILILLTSTMSVTLSQDTIMNLTLKECVDIAMKNNILIKQQENYQQLSVYTLRQNQLQMAPSLSFSTSINQDLLDENGKQTGGIGIDGSLDIFTGLTKWNSMMASKYSMLASKEETQRQIDMLSLDIVDLYIDIIYTQYSIEIAKERLIYSEKEKERIHTLVEVGQKEPAARYEIDAVVSSDRLRVTRAENNYQLKLLQLQSFLYIDFTKKINIVSDIFDLLQPVERNYGVNEIYQLAVENLPDIRKRELNIASLKRNLAIHYGSYSPTLKLTGGYGANFTSDSTASYLSQIDNNLSSDLMIEASLSFPIFSGGSNMYKVKRAKINLENALMSLEKEKLDLHYIISDAIQKLESFYLEFKASEEKLKFSEKSFETNKEKFSLGMINSTDYITAQNSLSQAKADFQSARLNWILQDMLVKYYKGEAYL